MNMSSTESASNKTVSRRDFLRIGATVSAGLLANSIIPTYGSNAHPLDTSRVVVVTDEAVLDGWNIQQDIVRIMVDAGIRALTGTDALPEAWLTVFPDLSPSLSIGLKINTINQDLSTHPEVSMAVAESLASTPVAFGTYPLNNILIWDRWNWELEDAGYTINTSDSGVRCFATNQSGVGYNATQISVHGSNQRVSRCYTDHTDQTINMCLLKNHTISGVTHALKNHYGTIHRPEGLHGASSSHCDPYIPALNTALIEEYGLRQKLCICDAIFGIRVGGPMGPPQFVYNGILLATDPVALDTVCRQILTEQGSNTIQMATHIDTAAGDPYNLGINDLENIDRIDVINPSGSVSSEPRPLRPDEFELGSNFPEPFFETTTIPFILKSPSTVDLGVYDLTGHQISTVFSGDLPAGEHQFVWNTDRTLNGRISSGMYIARLTAGSISRSRLLTLVR